MNRGSPNLVLDREDEERVQRGVSESVRGPEAARRVAPNRLRCTNSFENCFDS